MENIGVQLLVLALSVLIRQDSRVTPNGEHVFSIMVLLGVLFWDQRYRNLFGGSDLWHDTSNYLPWVGVVGSLFIERLEWLRELFWAIVLFNRVIISLILLNSLIRQSGISRSVRDGRKSLLYMKRAIRKLLVLLLRERALSAIGSATDS